MAERTQFGTVVDIVVIAPDIRLARIIGRQRDSVVAETVTPVFGVAVQETDRQQFQTRRLIFGITQAYIPVCTRYAGKLPVIVVRLEIFESKRPECRDRAEIAYILVEIIPVDIIRQFSALRCLECQFIARPDTRYSFKIRRQEE